MAWYISYEFTVCIVASESTLRNPDGKRKGRLQRVGGLLTFTATGSSCGHERNPHDFGGLGITFFS